MVMYCHNQINMNYIEKNAPNTEPIGILYPVRCRLFNLSDSNAHRHYNLDAGWLAAARYKSGQFPNTNWIRWARWWVGRTLGRTVSGCPNSETPAVGTAHSGKHQFHGQLPEWARSFGTDAKWSTISSHHNQNGNRLSRWQDGSLAETRSEEHTSELQSRE